jgi:hypothetical protein
MLGRVERYTTLEISIHQTGAASSFVNVLILIGVIGPKS